MIVQELKNVSNLLLTSTKQCTLWKKMCIILFYFFSCFYGSKSLVATAAVIQKCPMLICGQQDIFNSHNLKWAGSNKSLSLFLCRVITLNPWMSFTENSYQDSWKEFLSDFTNHIFSFFFPFIVNAVLPEGLEIMAIQHWFCPL